MRYLGGKYKLAKHIIPIMLKNRQPDQWFVEPFAGGMNLTFQVPGKRIANDNHTALIAMWQALQDGWQPPQNVSNIFYDQIKQNPSRYPLPLQAFVAIACSFGGKYFGGYARGSNPNYAATGKRAVLKQIAKMQDVIFTNKDYRQCPILSNSIVYCDPPYQNTTGYRTSSGFNHNHFWHWVREISQYHEVFVSEYVAPDDFEVLFQKEKKVTIDPKKPTQIHVEKLFRLRQ